MRRVLLAVVAAVVVAGLAVGGWAWWEQSQLRAREQARTQAAAVAQRFLDAWEEGDLEQLPALTRAPPDDLVGRHTAMRERLQADRLDLEPGEAELNDPSDIDAGATVPFQVRTHLAGLGDWSYRSSLALTRIDAEPTTWRVEWSPAVLHPSLSEGTALDRSRSWPERAPILDRDGQPLSSEGSLGLVVGHTGEVTAELLEQLGDPYLAGDTVGQRGLQLAFERQLAGSPTGEIRVVRGDEVVEVVHRFEGEQPQPLRTTLDPGIQRAAEAAMGSGSTAAMVVLDASTSEIRAVVNRPVGGFNRALTGKYPPGSTFKVVTATAILRSGVTPSDTVPCPETATVHGRPFRNFQGEAFGPIPFREAFYRSCNTAFVQLAADLDEGALHTAAADYGFNSGWQLPVGEPAASFPEPSDLAERAAAAIGQARVLVSPVQLASVAAAVAQGQWSAPTIVSDTRSSAAPRDLQDVAATLTELMREVPRRGTAEGAGLPDGLAGKTGTAEYGTGDPLPTHAWFIGFRSDGDGPQQDLAFAVLVEGGSSGGAVAAPVGARFLANLPP